MVSVGGIELTTGTVAGTDFVIFYTGGLIGGTLDDCTFALLYHMFLSCWKFDIFFSDVIIILY